MRRSYCCLAVPCTIGKASGGVGRIRRGFEAGFEEDFVKGREDALELFREASYDCTHSCPPPHAHTVHAYMHVHKIGTFRNVQPHAHKGKK